MTTTSPGTVNDTMGSTSIPTKTFHRKYFPYCLPGVIQVQVPHCFFWPVGWGWHRKEPSNLQRKTLHSPRLSFMHFCHPCPSCTSALRAFLPFVHFCPSCITALRAFLPFVHFCPPCISALHAFLPFMHFCRTCITCCSSDLRVVLCHHPGCYLRRRAIRDRGEMHAHLYLVHRTEKYEIRPH